MAMLWASTPSQPAYHHILLKRYGLVRLAELVVLFLESPGSHGREEFHEPSACCGQHVIFSNEEVAL